MNAKQLSLAEKTKPDFLSILVNFSSKLIDELMDSTNPKTFINYINLNAGVSLFKTKKVSVYKKRNEFKSVSIRFYFCNQ